MELNIIPPFYFNIWITCLIEGYETAIVAGMVKKRYDVSLNNKDGLITKATENCAGVVVSFCVSSLEHMKPADVFDDLIAVLMEAKVYFYSAIVAVSGLGSAWCAGNIQVTKITSTISETAKS